MSRIALTTSPERGSALAEIVTGLGHQPVLLPCITFAPADFRHLSSAREVALSADWLFVTSARAVQVLWPDGGMPHLEVAAVGEATARAVRAAGGTPTVIGDAGARELADDIGSLVGGRLVLFPHAVEADMSAVTRLEASGATVDTRPVYDVRPVPPGDDAADAVAFGSPSAVTGWCLTRSLDDVVVGAIGATTARALGDMGREPDLLPARPDFEQLIALMADYLRDRSLR